MTTRTSVDFIDADRVSVTDRGFTYGDGLFETLRVAGGRVPLWPRHEARLRQGWRPVAHAARRTWMRSLPKWGGFPAASPMASPG